MRTGQETGKGVDEVAVLKLSSLTIPLGALVTAFTCWFFWPAAADANIPGYQAAILLQGVQSNPTGLANSLCNIWPRLA